MPNVIYQDLGYCMAGVEKAAEAVYEFRMFSNGVVGDIAWYPQPHFLLEGSYNTPVWWTAAW